VPSSLHEAKRRVCERLLGTLGVHGVGIRAAESAVVLYVDPGTPDEDVRTLATTAAAPHPVIVVVEGRPEASGSARK
jgi:hypothetical protein